MIMSPLIAQSRNTYVLCTSYTARTYVPNLASQQGEKGVRWNMCICAYVNMWHMCICVDPRNTCVTWVTHFAALLGNLTLTEQLGVK